MSSPRGQAAAQRLSRQLICMEYTVPYKKQRASKNNSMNHSILKEQYLLLQTELENIQLCTKLCMRTYEYVTSGNSNIKIQVKLGLKANRDIR